MATREYSPYKCLHHLDALRAGKPVLCYWLITHRCNYDCPVCINKHNPHMKRSDELELLQALDYARQMKNAGVKALSISGGEPLIHRHFNELVTGLLNMGFEIGMISNGSLLGSVDTDLIQDFVWFTVSVNSMTAEAFSKVHGVAGNKIWRSLERYVPKLKSKGCVVGSSFLVQRANMDEIHRFADWSKYAGFDTCRYSYVRKPNGLIDYSRSEKPVIKTWTAQAKEEYEDENFRVFALSDRMDIPGSKAFSHCYMSDLSFNICANGNVYRCCSLQNTELGFLGSLEEKSFEEIWRERGVQDVTKCPMCWGTKKNEVLEYVMDEDPIHVNFV